MVQFPEPMRETFLALVPALEYNSELSPVLVLKYLSHLEYPVYKISLFPLCLLFRRWSSQACYLSVRAALSLEQPFPLSGSG